MEAVCVKHGLSMIILVSFLIGFASAAECPSFRKYFSKCDKASPKFDDCLLKALNKAKLCYQVGDPSLNIPVLEPLSYGDLIPPVKAYIPGHFITLNMSLPNITEWGWLNSTYTKVKTDFDKRKLVVYQSVPHKHVETGISVIGSMMGLPFEERNGYAFMDFLGVKQRFTIEMDPETGELKVHLLIYSVKKVVLSFYNCFWDPFVERLTNVMLERYWQLVWNSFKTSGHALSDGAKTQLGNVLYKMIDMENLFKPSPNEI